MMRGFLLIAQVLLLSLLRLDRADSISVELSVIVEPGNRECYNQYLRKDLNMEVDFQVISGGDGLDITFWISSPTNIVSYFYKSYILNRSFEF